MISVLRQRKVLAKRDCIILAAPDAAEFLPVPPKRVRLVEVSIFLFRARVVSGLGSLSQASIRQKTKTPHLLTTYEYIWIYFRFPFSVLFVLNGAMDYPSRVKKMEGGRGLLMVKGVTIS